MDPDHEDPRQGRDRDADDEERNEDVHGNRRRRARVAAEGIPLEGLLRLLAGQRVIIERRDGASNNEELVAGLKRTGMLQSDPVIHAMLSVPRGSFVPAAYRDEAWVDSPIRVEEDDFNISAPHMHAQMLESLEVAPGDRVLDVGCGCGFIAAATAVLAGRNGVVVGVDTKPVCVNLSKDNVHQLRGRNSEFATNAAPITFFQHNIFIPSLRLKGNFNKICVGATCPEDRLHLLLPLLEPGGGKLLAPVDNDLRLYTRAADGTVKHKLVSSVRFSDLEVPSDAQIALAVLQAERDAHMTVEVSPPSLEQDMQPESDVKGCGGGFMQMFSCFSSFNGLSQSPGAASDSLAVPETPVARSSKPTLSFSRSLGSTEAPAGDGDELLPPAAVVAAGSAQGADEVSDEDLNLPDSASAGSDGDLHMSDGSSDGSGGSGSKAIWQTGLGSGLGQPDCELQGEGWTLQAHKKVLKGRAAHFRARLSSGMRDAHDCQHKVPEGFSHRTMQSLLHYLYTDNMPVGLEPAAVVQLLHAAAYYGTPRLIELCEARLMTELLSMPGPAAAAEAPHLLCLADELGLTQLRRAAVAFIAQNYNDVQVHTSSDSGCLRNTCS
eukprot:GHUV01008442.1.p1 GENE.GHUV01008442.1~~GHUV01008442.1.p1  ORF type:complete len:607 (+),score=209.30 GHUV01008442.1:178-1998(+)